MHGPFKYESLVVLGPRESAYRYADTLGSNVNPAANPCRPDSSSISSVDGSRSFVFHGRRGMIAEMLIKTTRESPGAGKSESL